MKILLPPRKRRKLPGPIRRRAVSTGAGAYASNDFVLIGTDDGEASYTTGHASLLSLDPKTGAVISQITLPHTGDIRCNIVRQEGTNSYYFTSKGGYFYGVTVGESGVIDENSRSISVWAA